jgi:circadian clock protein KaiB
MRSETWILLLYVVGKSAASQLAHVNITRICEEHVKGDYWIDVIDLLEEPAMAERDQIFAVPTLLRKHPLPQRKLIGDLSNHGKVIAGLGMIPLVVN